MQSRNLDEAELAYKQALAVPNLSGHYRKATLNNFAIVKKLQHKDEECMDMLKQASLIKDEI